ncbi:siderophore-interacting protein [Georgenia sp.]
MTCPAGPCHSKATLTSPQAASAAVVKDDRPAYRPFAARVARVRELSPHFTRVTFAGAELCWFDTDRLDQRVKLLLPGADGRLSEVGSGGGAGHRRGDLRLRPELRGDRQAHLRHPCELREHRRRGQDLPRSALRAGDPRGRGRCRREHHRRRADRHDVPADRAVGHLG